MDLSEERIIIGIAKSDIWTDDDQYNSPCFIKGHHYQFKLCEPSHDAEDMVCIDAHGDQHYLDFQWFAEQFEYEDHLVDFGII